MRGFEWVCECVFSFIGCINSLISFHFALNARPEENIYIRAVDDDDRKDIVGRENRKEREKSLFKKLQWARFVGTKGCNKKVE